MKKFFAAITLANAIAFAKFCAKLVFEIVTCLLVVSFVEGIATFCVAIVLAPFGLSSMAPLVVFIAFWYRGIYRKVRAACYEYIIDPVYAMIRTTSIWVNGRLDSMRGFTPITPILA